MATASDHLKHLKKKTSRKWDPGTNIVVQFKGGGVLKDSFNFFDINIILH